MFHGWTLPFSCQVQLKYHSLSWHNFTSEEFWNCGETPCPLRDFCDNDWHRGITTKLINLKKEQKMG